MGGRGGWVRWGACLPHAYGVREKQGDRETERDEERRGARERKCNVACGCQGCEYMEVVVVIEAGLEEMKRR